MDANATGSFMANVTEITTEIAVAVLNETAAYMTSTMQMTSVRQGFHCNGMSIPCDESTKLPCLNDGMCCKTSINSQYCLCHQGWTGSLCENRQLNDDDYSAEESREKKLVVIGMSSIFSLIVGMLALTAFVVLAILILRKKLSLRQTEAGIEQNLTEIEDELNKMPTVTRLKHLTLLSKKFEASARATVEIAIQSAAVVDSSKIAVSLSPSARDCLPRWSSAPSCLLTSKPVLPSSVDLPDGPMNGTTDNGIPLIERPKLYTVVSYPA